MRGRQILYPNMRHDSNRTRHRHPSSRHVKKAGPLVAVCGPQGSHDGAHPRPSQCGSRGRTSPGHGVRPWPPSCPMPPRRGGVFIAYPACSRDHWYLHRLGQSQGCELRGLAERDGPGSSTVQQGMGALGASISRLRRLAKRSRKVDGGPKSCSGRSNWALGKSSGNLIPAFDSEAVGEFA